MARAHFQVTAHTRPVSATPWQCSVGGLPQPHNPGGSGSGRSPPCSRSDHGHRAQQARSGRHTHSHLRGGEGGESCREPTCLWPAAPVPLRSASPEPVPCSGIVHGAAKDALKEETCGHKASSREPTL